MTDVSEVDPWYDLSVVSDPLVKDALGHLLTDWRMRKRWHDLPRVHRDQHRAILRGYLSTGTPPSHAETPGPALQDLSERDLIVLDQGRVVGAYPFTSRPSRHSVEIAGCKIAAMCAIDALGAGAMARSDARVRSRCAFCDAQIEIDVCKAGLAIDRVHPAEARIWAGIESVSGCAADSQCRSMLLFCNYNHLEDWRDVNAPNSEGYCLTPAQALQLGAAVFRPFLARTEKETGEV
jgi:alkylmercury lyase-like protein